MKTMKFHMHLCGVLFGTALCLSAQRAATGEYFSTAVWTAVGLFELRVALQTWMKLRKVEAMKHMEQHLAAAVKALNEAIRKEVK